MANPDYPPELQAVVCAYSCCPHCNAENDFHRDGFSGHPEPCSQCEMEDALRRWRASVRPEFVPGLELPDGTVWPERDPSLPHQIVLFFYRNGQIAVSCNCQRGLNGSPQSYKPFGFRRLWQPGEVTACYKEHLT